MSFMAETRALALGGGDDAEMEEATLPGFAHDARTIHCAAVAHGQLLQVTAAHVRLVGAGGAAVAWAPPAGSINIAASSESEVCPCARPAGGG
jgi:hypothetical protein